MTDFTTKELDLLIDALTVWEGMPGREHTAGSIFARLMGPHTEETQEKLSEWLEEQNTKSKIEQRQRMETSTLLKAKLIGMKHQLDIDRTMAHLGGAKEKPE